MWVILDFILSSNFSALSPTCLSLILNLLSGEVLPGVSFISLNLLDLDGSEEDLQQLKTDTEELAFPRPYQVIVHSDVQKAFQKADLVILLDVAPSDDIVSKEEDDEDELEKRRVRWISERYREYGRMIDEGASKQVKVIVAPESYSNLACSLVLGNAPTISSSRFVAVSTQLENEARAVIAKKLDVRTSGESSVSAKPGTMSKSLVALQTNRTTASAPDVTDVIVWGNVSSSFFIDLQRAKVYNFDGAVSGPPFFFQPVLKIIHERFVPQLI